MAPTQVAPAAVVLKPVPASIIQPPPRAKRYSVFGTTFGKGSTGTGVALSSSTAATTPRVIAAEASAYSTLLERSGWTLFPFAGAAFISLEFITLGPYVNYTARMHAGEDGLVAFWGGARIPYETYWAYLSSASGMLMAIAAFAVGPYVDTTPRRKFVFHSSWAAGIAFATLVPFVPESLWELAGVLYMAVTTSMVVSGIVWLSYLLDLAADQDRNRLVGMSVLAGVLGFIVFSGFQNAVYFVDETNANTSAIPSAAADADVVCGGSSTEIEDTFTEAMSKSQDMVILSACAWMSLWLRCQPFSSPPGVPHASEPSPKRLRRGGRG
jgi:MFS-type transporter involved in bile tolerance (Atg22 family)